MIPESGWSIGELMPLDEWELPREKVVINRTIGEGAFGTVFGGECQFADNSPWLAVAVKTLKVCVLENKLVKTSLSYRTLQSHLPLFIF